MSSGTEKPRSGARELLDIEAQLIQSFQALGEKIAVRSSVAYSFYLRRPLFVLYRQLFAKAINISPQSLGVM